MTEPEVTTDAHKASGDDVPQPTACVSVDIAAGVGAVWEALVSDGGLEPWMGDGATIDPRPGGRLILPDPVGGRPRAGLVDTIDDRSELRFTWWPMTRPAERSTVAITVEPIETGARVTVRETAPPTLRATVAGRASATGTGSAAMMVTGQTAALAAGAGSTTMQQVVRSGGLSMRGVVPGFWAWRLATLAVSFQMARV